VLQTSVVLTEGYNVIVNGEELIDTTEYPTLYTRYRINRCRYKRVRLYIVYNLTQLISQAYVLTPGNLNVLSSGTIIL